MSFASLQPVDIKELSTQNSPLTSQFPEHLISLYKKSTENLTELEKSEVSKLLTEFQDIFVGPDGKFGRTPLAKHSIDTGNSKPIKIPPRRITYAQRPTGDQNMLPSNIIEPSGSASSAPLLLVKKKGKSWRFCVDHRKLNSVTRKDAYPLPKIDEALDALTGA
jgi:hypothetical protein